MVSHILKSAWTIPAGVVWGVVAAVVLSAACSGPTVQNPPQPTVGDTLVSSAVDPSGFSWQVRKSPLTGACYELVWYTNANGNVSNITANRLLACP